MSGRDGSCRRIPRDRAAYDRRQRRIDICRLQSVFRERAARLRIEYLLLSHINIVPVYDPGHKQHDQHLEEDSDDGSERCARLEAKQADRCGYGQFEEVRGADQGR